MPKVYFLVDILDLLDFSHCSGQSCSDPTFLTLRPFAPAL